MFKKVEVWILYLTILIGILFSIFFGVLVRQELVGEVKLGPVSRAALYIAELPTSMKSYLLGQTVINRFPSLSGFYGDPVIEELYLLLSKYDGDLQEGVVELIDLRTFKILHSWNPDIDLLNSLIDTTNEEFKYLQRDSSNKRSLLVHPILLNNGELMFGWEAPLRKIDSCSNLIWQNADNNFHHSIEVDHEGNIWVSGYLYPTSIPIEKVGKAFKDDAIVKISPKGKVLFQKSVSEILIENDMEYLLFSIGTVGFDSDPIHQNDIQPVNRTTSFWEKGDFFISLANQSMILLYRPSANKIIWKGTGHTYYQHDVDILDEYRISIFNNNSKSFSAGNLVDGNNEVIIYDFKTNLYTSYLKESLVREDVRTFSQGTSQILNNGDLFIEETNSARTLFFNADGSLRWQHINRANNGNVYNVGWSRILYDSEDIKRVNKFLDSKKECVNE